jgi:biotin carboxylase
MPDGSVAILALASELKALPFLDECHRQGVAVTLLTNHGLKDEAWPKQALAEMHTLPDVRRVPDVLGLVDRIARGRRIDQVVALDDYDVECAAQVREHLRLPGMDASTARLFRDKLAMRTRAREVGVPEPEFTGLFHDSAVRAFIAAVPGPWVLKPRTLAGSEGISVVHSEPELWHRLAALGDQRSQHLLEAFLPGAVFHVDALCWEGRVVFALASRYGAPPMAALQGRGVFSTRSLDPASAEAVELKGLNHRVVIEGMGRVHGPTHTEFICDREGRFHFLETAARVAGGNIEKLIEAATGVAVWQEAARMELCALRGEAYALPLIGNAFGGLIAAPSKVPFPDTCAYKDPEIFARPRYREFASLVVGAPTAARVEALLAGYAERFRADFMP